MNTKEISNEAILDDAILRGEVRNGASRSGRRRPPVPGSAAAVTVRELLRRYRLRPNRRRGQNFLVDDSVYDDLLRAAKLLPGDVVLEIGAGLGTLTERLAPFDAKVVAVEVDPNLVRILKHRLALYHNVTVVAADILDAEVRTFGVTQPYKVVANIPYNITGAIFKKFLTTDLQPTALTLLVQREVGERIVAAPGDMSLLALSVQLYATPRIVRVVPAASFLPPPEVASAILQVASVRPYPFDDVPEKLFWQVARVGFAAKRKQLHNNLVAGLGLAPATVKAALAAVGIAPAARAEDLAVSNWHTLAQALESAIES